MRYLVEGMVVVVMFGIFVIVYAEMQRKEPMANKHKVEVEQVEDKQPPMYIMQPVKSI